MEDKYYTPAVEDIHIGYECEVLGQSTTKLIKKIDWHTVKVGFHQEVGEKVGINQIPGMLKSDKIRTPYLTKQQIEAEGWKLTDEHNRNGLQYNYTKNGSTLLFRPEKRQIFLFKLDFSSTGRRETDFSLMLQNKSINELRLLSKLLEV